MRIAANVFDSSIKRWFAKVVRAAQENVNRMIEPLGGDTYIEYVAQFDTSVSSRVEVIKYTERGREFTQIVFATGDWQNLKEAIPKATDQLISALMALVTTESHNEIAIAFENAVSLYPVRQSIKRGITDELIDFYVYLDNPVQSDAFFSLIDRVDSELSRRELGFVSGNTFGLNGEHCCIDLCATHRESAQRIVAKQLELFGVQQYRFSP